MLDAGGAGMILANDRMDGEDIVADLHVLPVTMITYSEAVSLYGYMASTSPTSCLHRVRRGGGFSPGGYADAESRG